MHRPRRAALIIATLLGLALAVLGCSPAAAPPAPPPAKVDLAQYVLTEADIPGFTKGPAQDVSAPGASGVSVLFNQAPRVIGITLVGGPDAAASKSGYDQGVNVLKATPGAVVKEIKAGDAATRYDVAQTAEGLSTASVIVLVGKYVATIQFGAPVGDAPTDDAVNTVVQRQVDKLKTAP